MNFKNGKRKSILSKKYTDGYIYVQIFNLKKKMKQKRWKKIWILS